MNNLTLNLYMLLETQGWIPEIGFLPKGFKGVLMIRANRKKVRNQHQELTVCWKMPVGTASQWATLIKRIAHQVLLIHISDGVSEPWVMVFTVGSRKS
jgi:hypothetical protein